MNIKAKPGEVWYADLGVAAKSRPVLVLTSPDADDARHLIVVAPLTSQIRSAKGEVLLGRIKWLPKLSAVNVQGLASFHPSRLAHRMGILDQQQLEKVKQALRELLDL